MKMMDTTQTVLITGGSGGIGFELARVFAKTGHDIVLNGSNADRLETAQARLETEFGKTFPIFVQDLSLQDGAKSLYDRIKNQNIEVDILINNAGFGLMGETEEIDTFADETLMRLNVIALVQLCKLFLSDMYARKNGKILNLGSVAAFQPGPYNSTYFASKAFVVSYTRAIRYEAKKKGVQICVLCPGSTKTEFFDKEGLHAPPMSHTPQAVAEYAYKKFAKNKEIIMPGIFNKFSRRMPTRLKIKMVALMRLLDKESYQKMK